MTRLLLLIPTLSYRTADFMAAAHRLDVRVTVGCNQRQVLEDLAAGGALTVDFGDWERGVAQITAFHRDYPLTAIVGVDDETAVMAARASEALGLRHNRAESVEATENKYRLRSRLANSGLPAPPFRVHAVSENAEQAAAEAPYPCVLKPLALSASRGVIRANGKEEFVLAFRRIAAILERPDAQGPADVRGKILVEGYIPGREVAVEGLLENGRLNILALFDKPDSLEGPFFEETLYVAPSRLPEKVQAEVRAAAETACAALGLGHGPMHAEFRINDGGVWPVDVAARSIGGLCSRALRFGPGFSLEDLILRQALAHENGDHPLPAREREKAASGVMMIPIPNGGVLRRVDGLEEARAVKGIDDVTISIPVGGEVVPLPEGYRYLGFIFARAETPEKAEAALRAAHGFLQFSID